MEPYTVQAEYSFQGENNDELRFKKGDIITVTQREDGGWWEGTLGEVTGWFPSNYVKEYKGKCGVINESFRLTSGNLFFLFHVPFFFVLSSTLSPFLAHSLTLTPFLVVDNSTVAIGRNGENTGRNSSI